MPASYEIHPTLPLVRTRLWGVVTFPELVELYRAIAADPQFDPSFWQLADARDASEVHVDSAQARTIAELNVFARGARRAIVAAADEPFGVARMMESYSEMAEQAVQVFRDLDSAERWLGL
jgi:hypothetical protein